MFPDDQHIVTCLKPVLDHYDCVMVNSPPPDSDAAMNLTLNCLRDYIVADLTAGIHWPTRYHIIGALMLVKLGDQFNVDSFVRLLWKKNLAYGAAPIRRWGHVGVIIRIDSKWQRVIHLTGNSTLPKGQLDENLEDTLLDILGYCVLGVALHKEQQ